MRAFLARQRGLPFSYAHVGASRGEPPSRYVVDRHRARLGAGTAAFVAACEALRRWEMFNVGWVEVYPSDRQLAEGQEIAILAHVSGVWFLNACRVVYLVEESGPIERLGFAYGTLEDHAEQGEERFVVEWDHGDDVVSYEQSAFSRPNHPLVWAGYEFARRTQKRFARDAMAAMRRAVSEGT